MSTGDVSNSEFADSLCRDHHNRLLAWLNRGPGYRQRAKDLGQDTFVRPSGRPELLGLHGLCALPAEVTCGLMVDYFRRAALEQVYFTKLTPVPETEQPSAKEQCLILENLREIDRLLGTLSLKARSAFLYSRLDGIPYTEIVERLGVSVPRVHQYLAQGLRQCYVVPYGEPW